MLCRTALCELLCDSTVAHHCTVTPAKVDRGVGIANANVAGVHVLPSCVSCCCMLIDDVSAVSNEQHVIHVSFKNNRAGGFEVSTAL